MVQIRTLSTLSTSMLLSLSHVFMDTPAPRSKLFHPLFYHPSFGPSAVHTGNVVWLWEDQEKNLLQALEAGPESFGEGVQVLEHDLEWGMDSGRTWPEERGIALDLELLKCDSSAGGQ